MPHQGRPLEALAEVLQGKEFRAADYFGVSGIWAILPRSRRFSAPCEKRAISMRWFPSAASPSWFTFVADGRISNVLSHNKCAAGSGEFFVQQIGRMGLGMEEAIDRSFDGKVVPLAARCSVHCKSDITHKLNRNEASAEDILHTLHDSMAEQGDRPAGKGAARACVACC